MTKTLTISDVVATFRANLAELRACTNDDYILAWDNGLGVGFSGPNQPFAANLISAESIVTEEQARKMPEEAWAFTPIVKNGHGQQASLVKRQFAIGREIVKLEKMIAEFEAGA